MDTTEYPSGSYYDWKLVCKQELGTHSLIYNEGRLEVGRAWGGKLANKGGLRSTFSAANEYYKRY